MGGSATTTLGGVGGIGLQWSPDFTLYTLSSAASTYNSVLYPIDRTTAYYGAGGGGACRTVPPNYGWPAATSSTTYMSWISVAATSTNTYAIRSDGTLWAVGDNSYGAVGDTTTINRTSPTQVAGSWTQVVCASNHYTATGSVSPISLPSNGRTAVLAIKTGGTLWAWGSDTAASQLSVGRLGIIVGGTVRRSSPTQIGALATWTKIAISGGNAAGIQSNGTLWTWGSGAGGALGNSSTINRSSPVQVSGTTWQNITCGGINPPNCFMAATRTDGSLWTWGSQGPNSNQLGDNTTVNKSSPVAVGNPNGINYSNATLAAGNGFAYALLPSGDLYAWGYGQQWGNLGGAIISGTQYWKVNFVSPTLHSGSWSKIGLGADVSDRMYGIKTNGTLWAWGRNDQGQLGTSDSVSRSSPTQIGTNNQNSWVFVHSHANMEAQDYPHAAAINTKYRLFEWGTVNYSFSGANNPPDTYQWPLSANGPVVSVGNDTITFTTSPSTSVGGGGSGWGVGGSVVTGTQAAGVYPPFPGYPNSGGGGGGGFKATGYPTPGTGGSGVFFIMYPELYPAATTTGSPTVSSINGYRVYKFTSSGSIVFS